MSLPRAPVRASYDKRVGIVLAPPAVRDDYKTRTDGHAFILTGVSSYLESAFRSALDGSVRSVAFFRSTPPSDMDAYVYPELVVEATGMLNHRCTAHLTVELISADGKSRQRKKSSTEQRFVVMADGTQACARAVEWSFIDAAHSVLSALDSF